MALIDSSSKGDVQRVARLLNRASTSVHFVDGSGRSALHHAAKAQHVEVCGLLLRARADPNMCNRNGWTPLHSAAQLSNKPLVEMLCTAGASSSVRNASGQTPLDLCRDEELREILSRYEYTPLKIDSSSAVQQTFIAAQKQECPDSMVQCRCKRCGEVVLAMAARAAEVLDAHTFHCAPERSHPEEMDEFKQLMEKWAAAPTISLSRIYSTTMAAYHYKGDTEWTLVSQKMPLVHIAVHLQPGMKGKRVTAVTAGEQADTAGILVGDEVVEIDGVAVADQTQFPSYGDQMTAGAVACLPRLKALSRGNATYGIVLQRISAEKPQAFDPNTLIEMLQNPEDRLGSRLIRSALTLKVVAHRLSVDPVMIKVLRLATEMVDECTTDEHRQSAAHELVVQHGISEVIDSVKRQQVENVARQLVAGKSLSDRDFNNHVKQTMFQPLTTAAYIHGAEDPTWQKLNAEGAARALRTLISARSHFALQQIKNESRKRFIVNGEDQLQALSQLIHKEFFKCTQPELFELFRAQATQEDTLLLGALEKLSIMHPSEYGVGDPILQNLARFDSAVEELKAITKLITPTEKMQALVRTIRCVVEACGEDAGADELMPVLIHAIIKARPFDALHAEVRYASLEMDANGEEGYCASSFEAALEYILSHSEQS